MGNIKEDTRSLDYSSHEVAYVPFFPLNAYATPFASFHDYGKSNEVPNILEPF